MSELIREPQQQRSIDKKNRIVESGYELFAEKGYFNTNTTEIAKHAGVSTGIVYGYFHDKRDILLEALELYIDKAFTPILTMIDGLTAPLNFEQIIAHALDATVEIHETNAKMHETLHSLTATDEAVRNKFLLLEQEMTKKVVVCLKRMGYFADDVNERVHLAIETIQSYAHECVYDRHEYIDYADMRKIVLTMLTGIFVR